MPTIILNRSSEYINNLRNYEIYIDLKRVGKIANGESKEFNISPGKHTIIAKIDWCSSQVITFEVSDGQVKEFNVGAFKNAKWLMPAGIFIIVLSYIVNWKFGFDYLLYLAVPGFLLLVYHLTISRKNYLTLQEKTYPNS